MHTEQLGGPARWPQLGAGQSTPGPGPSWGLRVGGNLSVLRASPPSVAFSAFSPSSPVLQVPLFQRLTETTPE